MGDTAYLDQGQGFPVVLIHGVGLDHRMWRFQMPALAKHFRVIAYDLLGHGASAKPAGPYSLSMYADQCRDLLAGLGVDRAGIVGFSLGGLIAQAFCVEHPQFVAAAAILGCSFQRTRRERALILERVRMVEKDGPSSTLSLAIERWFSPEFAARNAELMREIADCLLSNDRDAYLAAYKLVAAADTELADRIDTIACPTLVMTGSEDRGNSPGMAMRIAEQIPGARHLILPGLRHMGMVEDPDAVNTPLMDFLSESLQQATDRKSRASAMA
ncbi:MAG: alpha/beta fold hydrolase [Parvibaculaceae bacterium]